MHIFALFKKILERYLLNLCPNLVIINPATQKNDRGKDGIDGQLKNGGFKVLDEKHRQETFKKG